MSSCDRFAKLISTGRSLRMREVAAHDKPIQRLFAGARDHFQETSASPASLDSPIWFRSERPL